MSSAKPRLRVARLGWIVALGLGSFLGGAVSGCASVTSEDAQAAARAGKVADAGSRTAPRNRLLAQGEGTSGRAAGADGSGPAGSYRPQNLPNVSLTPPLLAKLLAAEIGLQRQQLSTSYATYQDLAVRTRDARLARRATEIALTGRAFDQALASAQLWVELDPASAESQQTLETLQLATGKLKDVEPALARRLTAAREQGKLDETYLQLQRTLSRVQDRKEGWAMLQRLSQRDMDVVSARMARAAVAASADQKEAAAAEAAAALKLAPKDSTAAIAAAQYLQDLPDGNAQAATLLKRFLDKAPEDQAVRLALGRLYLADNKLKESGETLRAALKVEPENPQVLYSLAQVSYQAKEPAEAEGYLKRFIALPDTVARENAPAYLFLSQIAEEDQRNAEAISWLEKIQGGEIFISAVSKRAQLIARDGDVDKARGLINATTPRNQRERYALVSAEALVLREAKRNQESFDLLDKAVTQDAEAADLLYDHAMAAERIDRIPVMEKSLRKLIEVRPESAHAYNALGYTL
ncbi:MAG TPA: tetratricopeptide repeat protein, partial [Lautropia sp.]|nr:tetratricopeptide repeat protein [Lautropia sp.]